MNFALNSSLALENITITLKVFNVTNETSLIDQGKLQLKLVTFTPASFRNSYDELRACMGFQLTALKQKPTNNGKADSKMSQSKSPS